MPSRNSVIHDLLGTGGVTNAVALDMVGMNGSRMVGPALAGLLLALVDVKGGYIAVSIFQLLSLMFLWLVEIPTGHAEKFAIGRLVRSVKEGLNYTGTRGVLMATVAVTISPAPTPVAAMASPGPMTVRYCFTLFMAIKTKLNRSACC